MLSKSTKAKPPDHFGGNIDEYPNWKFTMCLFMKTTMPASQIETVKGVYLIGTYLKDSALNWYIALHEGFSCPSALFSKFELEHDIKSREAQCCTQLMALCNRPWKGPFEDFCGLYAPLAVWAEKTMDAGSMLNNFMFPQPQYIKDFMTLSEQQHVTTWSQAKTAISKWISRKTDFNRQPSTFLLQQIKTHSTYHAGEATPMEIGAVTIPEAVAAVTIAPKAQTAPPARQSVADFWKDKICNACGQKGHGKNYKGCPKHPEYKPGFKSKTYAASVSSAADHHSPVAASTSTAAASTSTAASSTSTDGEMQAMRREMADMKAVIAALSSNA
jgi:hypothetical protein